MRFDFLNKVSKFCSQTGLSSLIFFEELKNTINNKDDDKE